VIDILDLN